MFYESTRGGLCSVTSAEAIKKGIAPDGGLFVPAASVEFSIDEIGRLTGMTYQERAAIILREYLNDYTDDEICDCVNKAYNTGKFGCEEIAPVCKLNDNLYMLELWHGPTCAFKDMALQILPHLLVKAVRKTGENSDMVILVATSGDTGKAALEGFRDVEGTRIVVFFPHNGVSEVQRLQMVTQEGENVCSIAVDGNFDDTQSGVKAIFTDTELNIRMSEANYKFTSANSINWGRLVPQIVYYFSAYADMVKYGEINLGDAINIAVPTGNFGNILAAYYAMKMGLPVNKLICASNENNILTDFINTGIYDIRREFIKTMSPSMDILISSNLERLLYEITGHDSGHINDWMTRLKNDGIYNVDIETKKTLSKILWGGFTKESETLKTIEDMYKNYNYMVDTHTAVGIDVYDKYVISTGDMTKTIIASTASPFKFNGSVAMAVFGREAVKDRSEFELLEMLSEECGTPIPRGLKGLDKKEIRHKTVCSKSEMKEQITKLLGI